MSLTKVQLDDLKEGFLCETRYIPEYVQWLTEEGHENCRDRHSKSKVYYNGEIEIMEKIIGQLSSELSDHVVLVDIGAGLSQKTLTVMSALVKGAPQRKIFYMPMDYSDCVNDWPEYLHNNMPELEAQVQHITPIVGDVVKSLQKLGEYLPSSNGVTWEVVYIHLGPTIPVYTPETLQELYHVMTKLMKPGNSYWVNTYTRWHKDVERDLNQLFFNKFDVKAIMNSILKGFNYAVDGDIDVSKFDNIFGISEDVNAAHSCLVGGSYHYAVSKEKQTVNMKKLDLTVDLAKGEKIRCSEGTLRCYYHADEYMRMIGEKHGLKVNIQERDCTGIVGGIVYSR